MSYRTRIVDHICRYHSSEDVCYFGLPGVHWRTEKLIQKKFPSAFFMGAEWTKELQRSSFLNMPKNAFLFSGSASEALDVKDVGGRRLSYTCTWLDFTSCFTGEVLTCFRRLPKQLARDYVPFAITFYLGRETADSRHYLDLIGWGKTPLEKRCNAFKSILQGNTDRYVEFVDSWGYRPPSGGNMASILGVFHP